MGFAKRMQGVATRLLTKYDERTPANKMKLVIPGAKVWDGSAYVTQPATEYDITGVMVPISLSLVNGDSIKNGDAQVIITSDIEPKVGHSIKIDGITWAVVATEPVRYTDTPICYKAQVRK